MAEFIIIRGRQSSGKTTTAGLVYQELLNHCDKSHKFNDRTVNTDSLEYSDDGLQATIDFTAELVCKNKKIGIISAGDVARAVRITLNLFISTNIDIIICCARSVNKEGSTYRMLIDEFLINNSKALEISTEYSDNISNKYEIKSHVVETIINKVLELVK